jgi:hypothetical protein
MTKKVFLAVMAILAGLLLALAPQASATSGGSAAAAKSEWTLIPDPAFSSAALTCPASNLCVWPVLDGSSSRCTWINKDNDWWNAPTVCSWASSRGVKAVFNRGTSPNFTGVILYRGANFTQPEICVPQGFTATNSAGVILRSHQWTSGPC